MMNQGKVSNPICLAHIARVPQGSVLFLRLETRIIASPLCVATSARCSEISTPDDRVGLVFLALINSNISIETAVTLSVRSVLVCRQAAAAQRAVSSYFGPKYMISSCVLIGKAPGVAAQSAQGEPAPNVHADEDTGAGRDGADTGYQPSDALNGPSAPCYPNGGGVCFCSASVPPPAPPDSSP